MVEETEAYKKVEGGLIEQWKLVNSTPGNGYNWVVQGTLDGQAYTTAVLTNLKLPTNIVETATTSYSLGVMAEGGYPTAENGGSDAS